MGRHRFDMAILTRFDSASDHQFAEAWKHVDSKPTETRRTSQVIESENNAGEFSMTGNSHTGCTAHRCKVTVARHQQSIYTNMEQAIGGDANAASKTDGTPKGV